MAAARGCDAVLRLLDSAEANPPAYNLLCRYLALLDGEESARGDGAGDGAAGLCDGARLPAQAGARRPASPRSSPPARAAARRTGWSGFSGAAGGVVCAACERGGFELSREAHRFMVEALGSPLAAAPSASERALRQAERAVSETLEHHAHVRLRAAA